MVDCGGEGGGCCHFACIESMRIYCSGREIQRERIIMSMVKFCQFIGLEI